MGRYRPPAAQSSLYITRAGMQKLRAELDTLWKRRRDVTAALAAAAAEGDRSENAEYIYRKKELAGIDRRIRYLQKRIPQLKVVAAAPADATKVYFGAWVTVVGDDGVENTWRIVGPDEFDSEPGWISMDAPLARALMSRSIDDSVNVRTPQGDVEYRVVAIRYQT